MKTLGRYLICNSSVCSGFASERIFFRTSSLILVPVCGYVTFGSNATDGLETLTFAYCDFFEEGSLFFLGLTTSDFLSFHSFLILVKNSFFSPFLNFSWESTLYLNTLS